MTTTSQAKSSAPLILAAAIVLAAIILAFSPLLWTDHYIGETFTKKPVPAGCSIQTQTGGGFQGAIVVAHCPFWVQL
jgi:hypothetical protein